MSTAKLTRLSTPLASKWGDPISAERRAEMQGILDAWDAPAADHGDRKGPFDRAPLTGADVFWLAERMRTHDVFHSVPNLHLEGANLREAHLAGAFLRGVHLEAANLSGAHLERAYLPQAHLEGADLSEAHLAGVFLREAHLEGANLIVAHLKEASLREAHLEQADLRGAHLEGAGLTGTHLEGAYLHGAHLERATLRGAQMDGKTLLQNATVAKPPSLLGRLFPRNTSTALGDIRWGGVGTVDLTAVKWSHVARLGDEREAGFLDGTEAHATVVRAYRQLAAQLRAQGLSEVADRFSYRAQIRQRSVLLRQWRLGQYLLSWFLALLAGYGYQPIRTILVYLLMVAGFAATYFAYGTGCPVAGPHDIVTLIASGHQCTAHPMTWHEAFVVSFTAFHGRGFFVSSFQPSDPQATVAAAEAVTGLLIEISFIATFTQRFFTR